MTNENQVPNFDDKAPRTCTRCKGGIIHHDGYTFEGKTVEPWDSKCPWCNGTGSYAAPDYSAIVEGVIASKGKNKGRLRTSAPKYTYSDLLSLRVYYVWRMVRFSIGADCCMPVNAGFAAGSDPFRCELDALVDAIAHRLGYPVHAGALRWGQALGVISETDAARYRSVAPDSAYPGGPVYDENKPMDLEYWETR